MQSLDGNTHHVKHCIDYLRQSIACAADVTLEPFDMKIGGTRTWAVNHQCRDMNVLRDWVEENRVWDFTRIEG